jgi:hypothetical protein
MKIENVQETTSVETFEAPELTEVGTAADVVQGMPFGGWDLRGLAAPSFEFEADEEA